MPEPVAGQPPPTTTIQQEITLAGQRRINLIWEYTQAAIAIIMVLATAAASLKSVFFPGTGDTGVPPALTGFCGLVIGSYFQRTNHMNIGGVGRKATDGEQYIGR